MGDAGNMGGVSPSLVTLTGNQTITGVKTFNTQTLVSADPTLTGTVELGGATLDLTRIKMYESVSNPNSLHITSGLTSGGPAIVDVWPNNPSGLTDGNTSTAVYIFASAHAYDPNPYDVLQLQAIKLSSTPGQGSARYDIVSFAGTGGYLHPIYIGIQGFNKWIFNADGTINANSLAISNFKLGGSMDCNSNSLNNCSGFRGVSTADTALRGNPNATDTTERSLVFQALNASTDTFINVMKIEPAAAAPIARTTVGHQFDTYEDNKVIAAPSDPVTATTRRYAKQIDTNNDALCVKRKINGAVVEVQL